MNEEKKEIQEKRPLNGFFVFVYYLVTLVANILHPVTVIGRENLPEHGALLCPNPKALFKEGLLRNVK